MPSSPSGSSRVQVDWERLVRKASDAHTRLGRLHTAGNFDRLARVAGHPTEAWAATQWRAQVAASIRLAPPLAAPAWLSCLSSLSLACAAGEAQALREILDDDEITLVDGSSSRRVAACLRGVMQSETLDMGAKPNSIRPRAALHAFVESIALGHQALSKPLLPWLKQAFSAYVASSSSFLPEDWPPRQGSSHGLLSMIGLLGQNAFFMQHLFLIPSAVYLKQAHQQKNIDGFGLHAFANLCSASAPVDPALFSLLLGQGLDALGLGPLAAKEHSRIMLSGSIWRRDLPATIEFGLASWTHGASVRSNPHASVERAAQMLAQTLALRGLAPHEGDDVQRLVLSPGFFRQALASNLEKRTLALLLSPTGLDCHTHSSAHRAAISPTSRHTPRI